MTPRALLLFACLAGCPKTEAPPVAVKQATPSASPTVTPINRYQMRLGGTGKEDDQPRLGFKILKAYEKQKLDGVGHSDGGDWTFCDAETVGGARFTFGIRSRGKPGAPFAFGDAWILAADRAAGAKLTDEFARAFHVTAPPPGPQLPLAPLQFAVAILGTDSGRDPLGGYSGPGTWTATKLFPAAAEKDAEVFFNYSTVDKRGEFAQKDADYDKDVAEIWARGLRDGVAAKKPAGK